MQTQDLPFAGSATETDPSPPHGQGEERSGRRWPLARRAPEDKCDPAELLVDITFVLALAQAGTLLREHSGATGVFQTFAAMAVIGCLWQYGVVALSMRVVAPVVKLLSVAQTGLFLGVAIVVPEAFSDHGHGIMRGSVLFAVMMTFAVLCGCGTWLTAAFGDREQVGNMSICIVANLLLAVGIWCALLVPMGWRPFVFLLSWAMFVFVGFFSTFPTYDRFRIGLHPGWMPFGIRAFGERYASAYTVVCCLSLELLEQIGQAVRISTPMLALVGTVLLVSCVMHRLYDSLIEPAWRALDGRNSTVSIARKQLLNLSYQVGHVVMFGGLVVAAGAQRAMFTTLSALPHTGLLGPAVSTSALLQMYLGVAVCLLAMAWFSWSASWKLEWTRVVAPFATAGMIPLLIGRPIQVAVIGLVTLCTLILWAETRMLRNGKSTKTTKTTKIAKTAKPAKALIPRQRGPRTLIRLTTAHHEVSGFELLFDVMVAFAFSQTDVLVMSEDSWAGAARGVLVLAMIWGCWMSYVWAANIADADTGALRGLHIVALIGMILMGMTLPGPSGRPASPAA
ncbi:low temperature requirement protein A [Catenulispora yoronensis]